MFGIGKKEESADAPAAAAAAPWEPAVVLQPAGFWLRVVAFIVDYALLLILGGAMLMGAVSAGGTELVVPVYLLWMLIGFLYWPVLESTSLRATIGKAMVGLVVADIDGGGLPFVRSLLRNLAKIISAIPLFIGFLLAAFTTRKQALHDLITKAVVLRQGSSSFLRAIGVLVVGIALLVVGGYLLQENMDEKAMESFQAMMIGDTPMPAKPPVMAKPVAKPAPAAPAVQPAAPTPPAPASAVAAAPAASAAAASDAAAKPAATPAPAPAAKPAAATPAPAPAAAKPAAAPAPSPAVKPEPVKIAAAPKPPAMEERKPEPAPVLATRPRIEPVAASLPQPSALSPKFNDVMTAVLYRDRAAVTQLLDLGRWADKRDSNGLTPLMVATMIGDAGMVGLLLERGADAGLQAPGGLTALDFAMKSGDSATTQLLQRRGTR